MKGRKKREKTPWGILKERRRIRRKMMRAAKKKQKGAAVALKRCRKKKQVEKQELQLTQEASAPTLYGNLMRVVNLGTY